MIDIVVLIIIIFSLFFNTPKVYAYLDPGTGSYFFQIFLACYFLLKNFGEKLKTL